MKPTASIDTTDGVLAEKTENVKQEKVSRKKAEREATYSINELAANAMILFHTRQECAIAALKSEGKASYTVSEAKIIIEKFLKKEVL